MDEGQSTPAQLTHVAYIIAHELSHMWFGNLVGIGWWSQLWLKEGFATYFGWACVDALFPEWQPWLMFTTACPMMALGLDALSSTHPVEVAVDTEAKINEVFDAISYRKGASIIRMLATYLGPEPLRRGLSLYLRRHSYQSATTTDLWAALEEASGAPVTQIMPCWTQRPGFPLLTASLSSGGAEGAVAHLSQRRFTAQGSSVTAAAAEAATEGCPCGKAGCQPFDVLAVLNKRRPNPNPNPSPSPHPNPSPSPSPSPNPNPGPSPSPSPHPNPSPNPSPSPSPNLALALAPTLTLTRCSTSDERRRRIRRRRRRPLRLPTWTRRGRYQLRGLSTAPSRARS